MAANVKTIVSKVCIGVFRLLAFDYPKRIDGLEPCQALVMIFS